MASRIILLSWFCISLCSTWITVIMAGMPSNMEKMLESSVEYPFLTPQTYTEPISSKALTVTLSQDVTPENTSGDLYDQILPSRDPTTPISRNYLYQILKNNEIRIETPSTLATTIHAPPPLYKNSQ